MASGPGSGDRNAAPSAGTPAFFGMPNIRLLRVSDGLDSLAAEWRSWCQLWDAYTVVTGLDKKPNEFQASMFIASVGVDALTIVNALPYARQEDRKDLVKILDLMERHCLGAESEAYERFKFYSSFTQGARVTESLLRTSSQPYERLYERATSGRTRWTTRQKWSVTVSSWALRTERCDEGF